MCTVRAEKCKICVSLVLDDEFSKSLPSIKDEKLAINNIPLFNTKSLKNDIKQEYKSMKTREYKKTHKSTNPIANIEENSFNENPEHDSYNNIEESTGQEEYYTFLEITVNSICYIQYKDIYSKLQEIDFEYTIKINTLKSDIDVKFKLNQDLMIELNALVIMKNSSKN